MLKKSIKIEESLFRGHSIQTHLSSFDSQFRSQKTLEAGTQEPITAKRSQCF